MVGSKDLLLFWELSLCCSLGKLDAAAQKVKTFKGERWRNATPAEKLLDGFCCSKAILDKDSWNVSDMHGSYEEIGNPHQKINACYILPLFFWLPNNNLELFENHHFKCLKQFANLLNSKGLLIWQWINRLWRHGLFKPLSQINLFPIQMKARGPLLPFFCEFRAGWRGNPVVCWDRQKVTLPKGADPQKLMVFRATKLWRTAPKAKWTISI